MSYDALRKLAITLKPLTEIADKIEKIDSADQHLATVKGAIVAAQRDLDAAKEKAKQIIEDANKKASSIIANAEVESTNKAAKILDDANKKASELLRDAQEDSDDLNKKLLADQATHNMLKAENAELIKKKHDTERALKDAEIKLADIRNAIAAIKIAGS